MIWGYQQRDYLVTEIPGSTLNSCTRMGTARPWVGPMNLAQFDLIWARALFKAEWIVPHWLWGIGGQEIKLIWSSSQKNEVNNLLVEVYFYFASVTFRKEDSTQFFKSHCLCSCCNLTYTARSCPCPFFSFVYLFGWFICNSNPYLITAQ